MSEAVQFIIVLVILGGVFYGLGIAAGMVFKWWHKHHSRHCFRCGNNSDVSIDELNGMEKERLMKAYESLGIATAQVGDIKVCTVCKIVKDDCYSEFGYKCRQCQSGLAHEKRPDGIIPYCRHCYIKYSLGENPDSGYVIFFGEPAEEYRNSNFA